VLNNYLLNDWINVLYLALFLREREKAGRKRHFKVGLIGIQGKRDGGEERY